MEWKKENVEKQIEAELEDIGDKEGVNDSKEKVDGILEGIDPNDIK